MDRHRATGDAAPREPLRPQAAPSLRPWAGRRLGNGGVGELWLAGPESLVDGGGGAATLESLAASHGELFIGSRAARLVGDRFPLLVKVIDAAEWLSLQVHPSDAIAVELHGAGSVGKTGAWVVLDADPDARLITGPRMGLAEADVRAGIASGTLDRPRCESRAARAGDAYLIPAGTIHAIGAGLLVYEIEQPSDLTYRISDWGRPPTPGRRLHANEALRAVVPGSHAIPSGAGFRLDEGSITVPELRLEIVTGSGADRQPAGFSLEIVTAVAGGVDVTGEGWQERLEPFQTLVVPASAPRYSIATDERAMAFVGSIP